MNIWHKGDYDGDGRIPQCIWAVILTLWISAICGTICVASCADRTLNVSVEFKTPPVSITQNGGAE